MIQSPCGRAFRPVVSRNIQLIATFDQSKIADDLFVEEDDISRRVSEQNKRHLDQ